MFSECFNLNERTQVPPINVELVSLYDEKLKKVQTTRDPNNALYLQFKEQYPELIENDQQCYFNLTLKSGHKYKTITFANKKEAGLLYEKKFGRELNHE